MGIKNESRNTAPEGRGKNPNSLANLKPQKAGEPGHNPKGRGRDLLGAALDVELTEDDARAIDQMAIVQARRGDHRARDFVFDRVLGKAQQAVEHSGGVALTQRVTEIVVARSYEAEA